MYHLFCTLFSYVGHNPAQLQLWIWKAWTFPIP